VAPRPALRERLAAGDSVFGTFVFLPSPGIVEIMGAAGLDYVIIDLEHSPKSWETVENMVRAAELAGVSVLVRVRENDEKEILQALEIGAEGVVVPFVRTAAEASAAAGAVRYPPDGNRGTCTLTRVAAWGGLRGDAFIAHAARMNERVLVVAQVEDRTGIDNIEAIVAAAPGPEVVLIGRGDLATALGRPGRAEDPLVVAATDKALAAIRAAGGGCAGGIGVYSPGEVARWRDRGCRFFFYSADTHMLLSAARGIAGEFRSALGR